MQATQPPARTGPRPLALHLATEALISQLSFAGLTLSSAVSPLSKLPGLPPLPDLLQSALAESQGPQADARILDPVRVVDAVTAVTKRRMADFLRGVRRYHEHAARRTLAAPPAVWQRGAATLRDYGGNGPPVLLIPSLINRSVIVDLAPDRSLMRTMAAGDYMPIYWIGVTPGATNGLTPSPNM